MSQRILYFILYIKNRIYHNVYCTLYCIFKIEYHNVCSTNVYCIYIFKIVYSTIYTLFRYIQTKVYNNVYFMYMYLI